MKYHPLGTSGLRVSDLFLGTMTRRKPSVMALAWSRSSSPARGIERLAAARLSLSCDFIRETASFVNGTAGRDVVARRRSRPNPGSAGPDGESAA